jgi:hypothetical protein
MRWDGKSEKTLFFGCSWCRFCTQLETLSSPFFLMNWFYNNAGAADGPHDEETMAARDKEPKVLVWHSGLAEGWQEVAQLKPVWWGKAAVKGAAVRKPAVKESARELKEDAGRRAPMPLAPTQPAGSGGVGAFLKRLLGRVKK